MKLIANTPVGIFKRTTNTAYQYVVVWSSLRSLQVSENFKYNANIPKGVEARWVKDHGFGVTWHGSKQSADKSALGSYSWDKSATLVGVYEVQQ